MPLSLFSITVKNYQHIPFDAADATMLQFIIWGVCIGAVLASLLSLYQQNIPGKLVRALLKSAAHTEEKAVTLADLGLAGRPLINRELRRGLMLKKFVLPAQATAEDGTPRYYIPEELKYRAATRYEKKGNSLVSFIFTTLLAVAIAVLLMKLIPPILSMVDAIL